MEFIINNGYGGAMTWAIDMDDFQGTCGTVNPLIAILHDYMKDYVVPTPPPTTTTPKVTYWKPWNPSSTTPMAPTAAPTAVTAVEPAATATAPPPVATIAPPAQAGKPQPPSPIKDEIQAADVPLEVFPPGVANKINCMSTQQYFPHPDCSKYYWCVHGEPMLYTCMEGTHWDQAEKTCNWPEAVARSGC
ncbi:Endochitinase-like 2 [Homarus americanus]|uniref:Endochitinase-like 2 n=2 Tax=Homarus americanus TaxID=6706 RepID=A0A8J5JML3_HOMAM|nr:Endochitinase-like 2 [Homarus americanus]